MTINIKKEIKNRVYNVEIYTSLNYDEYELLKKYGEPEINIGGFIPTIPSQYKKLLSDSPFVCNNVDISVANSWITYMVETLRLAIESLRSKGDVFTEDIKIEL